MKSLFSSLILPLSIDILGEAPTKERINDHEREIQRVNSVALTQFIGLLAIIALGVIILVSFRADHLITESDFLAIIFIISILLVFYDANIFSQLENIRHSYITPNSHPKQLARYTALVKENPECAITQSYHAQIRQLERYPLSAEYKAIKKHINTIRSLNKKQAEVSAIANEYHSI